MHKYSKQLFLKYPIASVIIGLRGDVIDYK